MKTLKHFIPGLVIIFITYLIFVTGAPAQETPDCLSCHADVRHGQQNNTFCINCHINYTLVNGQHESYVKIYIPYVHRLFDWEGDNHLTTGIPEDEGCSACHIGGHEMVSARVRPDLFRKCEDCHVPGGIGPVPGRQGGWILRNDIDDFTVKIYAHYTGSGEMNVDNQAGVFDGNSVSSCFDYNVNTTEGTCHGVAEVFADSAGGYFAHVNSTRISQVSGLYNKPSDPYQLDVTVDNMPDTSDCMFCHYQEDELVRKIWGGAVEPVSEVHLEVTKNPECWECHTKDGNKPKNFHSDTMGDKEEEQSLPLGLIAAGGLVLVLIGAAAYYFMVIKKK